MAKYWEIVQLAENRFALQSSDEQEAPMVEITFSAEAESLLQDQLVDVARAMISAGVQSASMLQEEAESADSAAETAVVLH